MAPDKKLLVEGKDDQHSVVHLVRHHLPWGDAPEAWPARIEPYGGVDKLFAAGYLTTQLKASDALTLGLMIDANEQPASRRWQQVRTCCLQLIPQLPEAIPVQGAIVDWAQHRRFGVWIMPDNRDKGMLETFLASLLTNADRPLWEHAKDSTQKARMKGAVLTDQHLDKAYIHTWLAWQKEPGRPFGTALTARYLDPLSPSAAPFIRWFKGLYRV
jgi:hypothetical protein